MKKEENKKGISLVTLIIILILAVCIEGVYIVKLRGNTNEEQYALNDKENINTSIENNTKNNNVNNNTLEKELDVQKQNELSETENKEGEVNSSQETQNQSNVTDENVNPTDESQVVKHTNEQIIDYLGYNIDSMVDSILDSIELYAGEGKITKTQEGSEPQVLTNEEAKNNREIYRDYIKNNINNSDLVVSIKYENGKLTCDYNYKNLITFLGLNSNNFTELETNENGIKSFTF